MKEVIFIASVCKHILTFHLPYIELLKDKGYKVSVATNFNGEDKSILENQGIQCFDVNFDRNPLSKYNLDALHTLKLINKKNDYEIIHVHTPIAAFLARLVFRKRKERLIYTAHGFHFFKGAPLINWLIYYPLERIASKWTGKLITINNEDYNQALTMGFLKENVYKVHGVGVNIIEDVERSEDKELKKSLSINEESIVISCIAEINKNKNQKFLLDNWEELKKQCPQVVLLLIGEGNLLEETRKNILEIGLDDVHILGYRKDIHNILEITDIVTLLSQREGLPKSIMEAMVAKKPCIVTNTRGLRDLVKDRANGFIIEDGDNTSLIKAFKTLIENRALRIEMGQDGYEKVKKYSLENVLPEYECIYDQVLRKTGSINFNKKN